MSVLMTLLGVLVIVLGGLSTAYGIIINEFSLGNTLLLIGAIGIVGGLLLIAIASAARQLRRIADILSDRVPPRAIREVREPAFAPARRAAAKARAADAIPTTATDRPEQAAPSVRAPEPKLDRSSTVEQPSPEPVAATPAAADGEPAVLRTSERPPIAPVGAPPSAAEDSAMASATHEPAVEAAHTAESESVEPAKRTGPAEQHVDETAAPAGAASPAPSAGLGTFDSIWPQRRRTTEPAAEKPEPAAPEAGRAAETESVPIAPAGEGEPAPSAADDSHATEQPAPHAVSILKSGVVDGMAYTLYSDGSIEAELPSGTIRFASIKELRQHLERAD